MARKSLFHLPNSLRMGLLIAVLVGVLIAALAWFQIERERRNDLEEMDRRAYVLAHQMVYPAQVALQLPDSEAATALGSMLEGYRRLIGLAVYRTDGRLVAAGKGVADFSSLLDPIVEQVLAESKDIVEVRRTADAHIHLLASVIRAPDGQPQGTLAVLHDLVSLDERATHRRAQFGFWIGFIVLSLLILTVAGAWLLYDRPLNRLAEWMRQLRTGDAVEAPPIQLPIARLANESDRLASSLRVARLAQQAQARAVMHATNAWTRDRLRAHVVDCLRGGQLLVVSNREPYMHELRDGKPHLIMPAGGLVTALDPVLQACGGVWVAHGSGEADRRMADAQGRLAVPPDDPTYTLRRVWLTREEEQGYYYGFANEGLWPLCHLAHERPIFRAGDWEHYVRANRRFAEAALEEAGSGPAVVLVQDYQMALVPRFLKEARPELAVGIFWHIPWPNPEAFRICPWGPDLLRGILGADLIGFHLQQHCNNFLDTVDRTIEARLDWDHFAVELQGHPSLVRPFPISVESWDERHVLTGAELERQIADLQERYKLGQGRVAVGVDRIDYTKGMTERFRAVARFFERCPQYREQFTFVQLGAPSRTHIPRYRNYINELETLADDINWRFQTESWKPIRFLIGHHDGATVHAFLRMAEIGIVSSLHDGMNLVAKEFVAAKSNLDGVLILSEFAGAARELVDALIINPYDTEQFAEAIRRALEMAPEEREARMARMRRQVEENNIYRWAANFLADLTAVPIPTPSTQETA
ncbi:MAG: trehalose-6-phosphate synthase [Candidatus Contendobacter sp.]|nr:trehalose-6-phosphate synthase [Candidatus Contendobacter sp.]